MSEANRCGERDPPKQSMQGAGRTVRTAHGTLLLETEGSQTFSAGFSESAPVSMRLIPVENAALHLKSCENRT